MRYIIFSLKLINAKKAYDKNIRINKIRHENLEVILSAIMPASNADTGLRYERFVITNDDFSLL